jgi:hypothetical protein
MSYLVLEMAAMVSYPVYIDETKTALSTPRIFISAYTTTNHQVTPS